MVDILRAHGVVGYHICLVFSVGLVASNVGVKLQAVGSLARQFPFESLIYVILRLVAISLR